MTGRDLCAVMQQPTGWLYIRLPPPLNILPPPLAPTPRTPQRFDSNAFYHRRRIYTVEKAKVVAAVCGTEALAILQ